MRIAVDIGHPSQVHFFKNFIIQMQKKGHQILITVSEKDIAVALLQYLDFKYTSLGSYGKSLFQKIIHVPVMDIKMLHAAADFKPDIFLGFGSVRAAHAAWLLRKPCIIFDGDNFTFPYYRHFASSICLFSGCEKTSRKIINVPSYKELAYLHPRWFTPCTADKTEGPVTVLRFVSRAFHDIGKEGFDLDFKKKLVSQLEKYSAVYISSESPLPAELERNRLKIKPQDMHNFLSGVNLLFTDSGSMTMEAAVLGIPVVRCNTFIGQNSLSIFQELENKYGLIFNIKDRDTALNKAIECLQRSGTGIEWKEKQKRLLKEKIDVTLFMLWLVEQYPASIESAQSFCESCLEQQSL